MQFAINWSPEASALLKTGAIQLDLFKCPDWVELVNDAQAQLPSYVHFPLAIGNGQSQTWDFERIQHWLDQTDTRFVNCHIVPNTSVFSETIGLDALTEQLTVEVQQLVDAFGTDRVIIENCPYFIHNIDKGVMIQCIEPQIFHDIIDKTGCGFLLDMAHAVLNCQYLKLDFADYSNQFPVRHIHEFHITGIGTWSTGVVGDHMPMTTSDWQALDYCLSQMQSGQWRMPDVIAFEYGGIKMLKDLCGSDSNIIAEQVPRLYQMAHSLTVKQN